MKSLLCPECMWVCLPVWAVLWLINTDFPKEAGLCLSISRGHFFPCVPLIHQPIPTTTKNPPKTQHPPPNYPLISTNELPCPRDTSSKGNKCSCAMWGILQGVRLYVIIIIILSLFCKLPISRLILVFIVYSAQLSIVQREKADYALFVERRKG